jgi:hypothetical protein
MRAMSKSMAFSAAEVQASAPTAYGVFQIVYDGQLVSYHYLGQKEKEMLVQLLARDKEMA